LYWFAIVLSLGLNSCGKDSSNSDIIVYKIPVDIAARYVVMAFCNASAGINLHMENAAAFTAQGYGNFDSTFTIKKLDSAATVKYQYQVEYVLHALLLLPQKSPLIIQLLAVSLPIRFNHRTSNRVIPGSLQHWISHN